jgi:PAS domain S-box-containing protein
MPNLTHHSASALEAAQAALAAAESSADALKTSELRYRRLFEAARDGILLLDSDRGRITDANPFMTELLGYSHAEMLGKQLWEIGLLQDKKASQEAFRVLRQDDYIRYENLPLLTRDGEQRQVEFVSNLYREDGHTAIQCNIRDITERKASEFKVKVSELRYRRLFETARDGILILDSETCTITDANPFMTELLGYSRADLVGKELWEIGLLQDREANEAAFQRLKRDGYIRYEDLPLENRRGELREVEFVSNMYQENGHTVIQCNIRDITESKAADKELAAAAAKDGRIAETLQRSMLQKPPVGKFPGLVVETLYEAALDEADVGGDFFDAFALSQERIALVVGDVTGKGLVAAGRTAEVKYALRAFLHGFPSPELAFGQLNDFIFENHRLDRDTGETFIVLALAVIDTTTGEATFAAAGAEPTLILRADGQVEKIAINGLPLGIQPDTRYVAKALRLDPGDTIIMATDGITEARCGNEFLGTEGLRSLVKRAGPAASLRGLSQTISAGAHDFAGGGLRDDVCLLLARRQ